MSTTTQTNKVYEYIIEQLKSGRWKPGERIYTEQEWCDELGVSRIVVREAVEKCVALGILSKRKGSGTYLEEIDIASVTNKIVPLISLQPMRIADVMNFRMYFEPGNVREFIRRGTAEELSKLDKTLVKMKELPAEDPAFYEQDLLFHNILAQGTRNPIVISVQEMLSAVLRDMHKELHKKIGASNALKYHELILDAIREGDEEVAALMMRRHIESAGMAYSKE